MLKCIAVVETKGLDSEVRISNIVPHNLTVGQGIVSSEWIKNQGSGALHGGA